MDGNINCRVLAFVLFVIIQIKAQDPSVFGMYTLDSTVVSTRTTNLVYSKCFAGLGMTTCQPVVPDDDTQAGYNLDYYNSLGTKGNRFWSLCLFSLTVFL